MGRSQKSKSKKMKKIKGGTHMYSSSELVDMLISKPETLQGLENILPPRLHKPSKPNKRVVINDSIHSKDSIHFFAMDLKNIKNLKEQILLTHNQYYDFVQYKYYLYSFEIKKNVTSDDYLKEIENFILSNPTSNKPLYICIPINTEILNKFRDYFKWNTPIPIISNLTSDVYENLINKEKFMDVKYINEPSFESNKIIVKANISDDAFKIIQDNKLFDTDSPIEIHRRSYFNMARNTTYGLADDIYGMGAMAATKAQNTAYGIHNKLTNTTYKSIRAAQNIGQKGLNAVTSLFGGKSKKYNSKKSRKSRRSRKSIP